MQSAALGRSKNAFLQTFIFAKLSAKDQKRQSCCQQQILVHLLHAHIAHAGNVLALSKKRLKKEKNEKLFNAHSTFEQFA